MIVVIYGFEFYREFFGLFEIHYLLIIMSQFFSAHIFMQVTQNVEGF